MSKETCQCFFVVVIIGTMHSKLCCVLESKKCKCMSPGLMEIFQLELCTGKLLNNNVWYAFPDGV